MEIAQASFPKTKISRVSFGYLVVISSASAMATFLAGVILSSPYKIILWLISIINTVLI
jgi:hypothetical protein